MTSYHMGILIPFFEDEAQIAEYKLSVDKVFSGDIVSHIMNCTLGDYATTFHKIFTIDSIFHRAIPHNNYSLSGIAFDSDEGRLVIKSRDYCNITFIFRDKQVDYKIGRYDSIQIRQLFSNLSVKSARSAKN
jgi:hypothetical protein